MTAFTYSPADRDYIVYNAAGEPIGAARTATAAQTLHDQLRYRQALAAAGSPAIDVAELAAAFRESKVAAVARLGMLTREQLVVEAYAYAAYLSELYGEPVAAEGVLANW